MPSLKFSNTNYRYGFNGKENDPETGTQDYGMRIYDSRIGKFLSVDPLSASFPWNSSYAFAENDVIRSIDLEGGERLGVNVISEATPEKIGKAAITITMDHYVVTSGTGEVSNTAAIDTKQYAKIFNKTTVLYAASLPTKDQNGKFLTGKYERWARKASNGSLKHLAKLNKEGYKSVYKVDVSTIFTLHMENGLTIQKAMETYQKDPQGTGIVLTPPTNPVEGIGQETINQVNTTFLNSNNKEASTVGSPDNYVFLNPSSYGPKPSRAFEEVVEGGKSGDGTEIVIHGVGHNVSKQNTHSNSSYQYTQEGLQSNLHDAVFPTKPNIINIINDKDNRQTIKEEKK